MRDLDDLEGVAIDGRGYLYLITSHSRQSTQNKGREDPAREKLVRFRIEGDRIVDARVESGLKAALTKAHPLLARAAKVLDVKRHGGLNIEGLVFDQRKARLMVGFRTPQAAGRAVVAQIENPAGIFERREAPKIAPDLIRLDLDGEGIRGMVWDNKLRAFLIISRREIKDGRKRRFHLWSWSGDRKLPPRRIYVPDLHKLRKAEGITPVRWRGKKRFAAGERRRQPRQGQAQPLRAAEVLATQTTPRRGVIPPPGQKRTDEPTCSESS